MANSVKTGTKVKRPRTTPRDAVLGGSVKCLGKIGKAQRCSNEGEFQHLTPKCISYSLCGDCEDEMVLRLDMLQFQSVNEWLIGGESTSGIPKQKRGPR